MSKNTTHRSVLQDWVHTLSFMQQSVLITAVRGPDGIRKDHPVKKLLRWYRRCVLISAFDGKTFTDPYTPGGGSFTGPIDLEVDGHAEKYVGIYLRHVDELPHHFQLHFMHAAEIVGYTHPDPDVQEFWAHCYYAIVKDAHLRPEPAEAMMKRLGDDRDAWLDGEVVTAR